MTTPNRLSVVDHHGPGGNPVNVPDYVAARVLGAAVAENITVPASVAAAGGPSATGKAAYVRIAANADIFYSFSAAASVPAADIDDGTACELLKAQSDPEWRLVPQGATNLSVICAGTAIVTASFYLA